VSFFDPDDCSHSVGYLARSTVLTSLRPQARRAAKNAIAGHGGILKAFRAFLQRHAKVFHLILIIIEVCKEELAAAETAIDV